MKGKALAEDGSAVLTGDIEVSVVGQIDDGGLVGSGVVLDPNNVAMKAWTVSVPGKP
jgi:hypothetical protein